MVLHMLHAIHIPWPVFIITEVFCVTRAPLYVYMIGAITINIECPQVRTNSEMLEFLSFFLTVLLISIGCLCLGDLVNVNHGHEFQLEIL